MSSRNSSALSSPNVSGAHWIDAFKIDTLRAPRWLHGPHLQTYYAFRFRRAKEIAYMREVLETPDGDFIDIDWTKQTSNAPLIIACHGLEGSSRSRYIRRLMSRASREGFDGLAVNHRTCGGRLNQTIRTYHYGFINDLDQVVRLAAKRSPERPIIVVGYSLGGSIVVNWLGRCASTLPKNVCGAATVSAPLTAGRDAHFLDERFRLYGRFFLRTMRRKARLLTEQDITEERQRLDLDAICNSKTMEEFETHYTAPAHGFTDLDSYYQGVSPEPWIDAINVPTLMLHASDDPVIASARLPAQQLLNLPNICFSMTRHGGHVGFVSRDQNHWLEDQLVRWFHSCLSNAHAMSSKTKECSSVRDSDAAGVDE